MSETQASAIDPSLLVRASVVHGSPSSLAGGTKRNADPLESPVPKVARSSDEEKKARLLARQQRNRHSAQVSREKKKAHVEQLEWEVKQLREEKKELVRHTQEGEKRRRDLEMEVRNLGFKVQGLEKLLVQLFQTTQVSLGDMANGAASTELANVVASLSSKDCKDETASGEENASAAPAAAPSTTVPESCDPYPVDSTCLPAAKATSDEPGCILPLHLAQQRVHIRPMGSRSIISTQLRRRQMRQPMAAALRSPSWTKFLQQASVASPNSLMTRSCSPRPLTHGTSQRIVRIRLRIPSARLHMALKQYSLRQVTL